ncbi:unknown [[Mannheimia] succiniciproducens MBEL55E]|uniref:Uncharacterized protein n=1 Tax=Mannheimia succiniciproducens (strain KCTC 0769BP / MBEL55E) TaxID=221988 RepID=Q65QD3_MANSM|nr:unknown [[Mannheimia] succiniciproducens MBEL55E]
MCLYRVILAHPRINHKKCGQKSLFFEGWLCQRLPMGKYPYNDYEYVLKIHIFKFN